MVQELYECRDESTVEQPDQRLTADKAEEKHDVQDETDFHHFS